MEGNQTYTLQMHGGPINTRRVFQITSTPQYEIFPSWPPDGRALAYVIMESAPDGYSFELWKMRLSIDDVSMISSEMLSYLGYIEWGKIFTLGDPCWRKLEGLRIIQSDLKGRVGNYVEMSMQAVGGIPPYTWELHGTLPNGLHFGNGIIYGTPTEAVKEHHVILNVTDSIGLHTSKDFVVIIKPSVIWNYLQLVIFYLPRLLTLHILPMLTSEAVWHLMK